MSKESLIWLDAYVRYANCDICCLHCLQKIHLVFGFLKDSQVVQHGVLGTILAGNKISYISVAFQFRSLI